MHCMDNEELFSFRKNSTDITSKVSVSIHKMCSQLTQTMCRVLPCIAVYCRVKDTFSNTMFPNDIII